MDFLEELKQISAQLDDTLTQIDNLYKTFKRENPDLDCMCENLAMLGHDIQTAKTFSVDIYPDMKDICDDWEGTWDDEDEFLIPTPKGSHVEDEYNPDEDLILDDPSLDDSAEGEWGTRFPDMSEED